MRIADFAFHLPEKLIAQSPAEPRDHSRLLLLDKKTGKISEDYFFHLERYLQPGDVLVFNDSKVIPARLIFEWNGKEAELLLVRKIDGNGEDMLDGKWRGRGKVKVGKKMEVDEMSKGRDERQFEKKFEENEHLEGEIDKLEMENDGGLEKNLGGNVWEVMGRPGKMLRKGVMFEGPPGIQVEVLEVLENGLRIVKFSSKKFEDEEIEKKIFEFGRLPLPPYIENFRESTSRYQTIYSKNDGSIAAPTAGLHFTKRLLKQLIDKGVQLEFVTLHVGLGTFLPVKVKDTQEHVMHTERFEVGRDVARRLNGARADGRRIVAVGTTAARVLESAYDQKFGFVSQKNSTQIFIQPGYKFQALDALITNFHLPQSTLLMLVSAFAGKEKIARAYEYAIHHQFHFYSFGDAMLIS